MASKKAGRSTNAKNHKMLGNYLVKKYMSLLPKRCIRAFLIGCVQPDRNPATYLKGSIRRTWLRGHNWNNAKRFMARLVQEPVQENFHITVLNVT